MALVSHPMRKLVSALDMTFWYGAVTFTCFELAQCREAIFPLTIVGVQNNSRCSISSSPSQFILAPPAQQTKLVMKSGRIEKYLVIDRDYAAHSTARAQQKSRPTTPTSEIA